MGRTLWLLRHARPLVEPGLCYGRLDMAADPQATAEAAQALAPSLPQAVYLRHSPLRRCTQLATALQALRPGLPLHSDARLQEMDFGKWEGQPWNGLGRQAIDDWAQNLALTAPGGGESLQQMLQRVQPALREALSAADQGLTPLWITHAGVARCVQWLLLHGLRQPTANEWTLPAPAFGQVLKLDLPCKWPAET